MTSCNTDFRLVNLSLKFGKHLSLLPHMQALIEAI